MLTPRGGGGSSPRPTTTGGGGGEGVLPQAIDFVGYQRKKYEGLLQFGALNQDVIETIKTIMRNALACGQTHTRVQTIHLATQYGYSFSDSDHSYVIHDAHTMLPYTKTKLRVLLSSNVRRLVEWLREQGIHVVCATKCMSEERKFGDPTFAEFMHVMAVFVPESGSRGGDTKRVATVWNSVYAPKQLDIKEWNERCLAAIRAGMMHFTVCAMYAQMDFAKQSTDNTVEFNVVKPRNHLSMTYLENDPGWAVKEKYAILVSWVAQTGYKWTLATNGDAEPKWAYFLVILDPLDKYH